MNKRFLLNCCLLVLSFCATGQNLVPNPSFELYYNCPTGLGGINFSNNYSVFNTVQAWASPAFFGTPDYFNTCAPQGSGVSIPVNFFGYQHPRTGNAYAGFIFYNGSVAGVSSSYEYIYCRLNQPLVAGAKYKAGFYVSLAARDSFPINQIALDKIGVHFSDTIVYKNPGPVPGYFENIPYHIESRTLPGIFLDDTSGWMKVSGIYTAKGGEQYMLMGRFHYGVPPSYKPVWPSVIDSSMGLRTYYYIDDVFVEPFYCDTATFAHDSLSCDYTPMKLWSINDAERYYWSNGDTAQHTTIAGPGTYWCLAVTDSCDARVDTFHVKRFTGSTANRLQVYGCNFSGAFSLPLSVPAGGHNYLWVTGDTTLTISVADTGVYYCHYIKDCILHTDTFFVGSFQGYPSGSSDTVVCRLAEPFSAELTAMQGASSYLWSTGAATPSVVVYDTGTYTYTAVKDCQLHHQSIHVRHKVFEPVFDLGNDTTVCSDNEMFTIGKDVEGASEYTWNTGGITCCTRPDSTGKYTLTISDGCTEISDDIEVTLSDCENCLLVPNAFSPNNDSRNDRFKTIVRCPVGKYDLMVFNRWGQKVFHTNDISGGWDGVYNGKPADIGVYYYLVKYTVAGDNKERIDKGDITLIR